MLAERVPSGKIYDMVMSSCLCKESEVANSPFQVETLLIHLATDLLNRTAEKGADIAHPNGVLSNQDLICA